MADHSKRIYSTRERDKESLRFGRRKLLTYGSVLVLATIPIAAIAWNAAANMDESNDAEPTSSVNLSPDTSDVIEESEPMNSDNDTNLGGTSVELHSSSQSTTSSGSEGPVESTNETSLKINGEEVEVPESGQLHQTFTSPDGSTTTVNITATGVNSSSSSSSSSISVDVDSNH